MEKILNEFLELVTINSPTKGERQMADVLTKKLQALGCTVTEDDVGQKIGGTAGNLYAVLEGTLPGSVLFTAHMDRVPNGIDIKPVIHDELVTSDGSTILAADDLAGVCAILDCLRRLHESKKPHCTVEILFTASEEIGLAGSRNLDHSIIQSKQAYVFDSSGRIGRIIKSAPSKADITIEVHGKNAHAGNEPEKGIDATRIAAKFLAQLPVGRLDAQTVSNFPIFKTNATATNVVCDYATIIGEARSGDHSKLEKYLADIQALAKEIAEQTNSTIHVNISMDVYAFCIDNEADVIQNAVKAMNQLGIDATITPGGGCMDANWFNRYGIESVGIATGYMANHTPQEHLYINDLILSGQLAETIVYNHSQQN